MKLTAPKGTKDILPNESKRWQFMEDKARDIFEKANYQELRTPVFEATELFSRGVGTSTDIVTKEMYTFIQKERSLTLRPENTAGVVRAYIEHGMHKLPTPLKLWYKGPMFRYERPQAGRQRQFHQVGLELFGIKEPSAEAEAIQIAMRFLEELKIPNLSLEVNSIGCSDCRQAYREKIKDAIRPKLSEFCEDCVSRFEKNPLRMIDCKNPKCKELLNTEEINNIVTSDYICGDCSEHFTTFQEYLNALGITYKINKKLVRGLDYYNRTVFEITSSSLGAQNAVCGGGRYDPLVEILGGPATPAFGWAMGMERLMALMPAIEEKSIHTFIVSTNTSESLKLASELRNQGISCDFDLGNRKFPKQMEKASKLVAKFALILGEDEINEGTVTVKNLSTGEQQKVNRTDLLKFI